MKYETSRRRPRTSKFNVEPNEKSPRVRAREAIEVRLHDGALFVLKELDVALPDEIFRCPSSLRRRRPVLQDAASALNRLEAGEEDGIATIRSQESA